MSNPPRIPPPRRPELVFGPVGADGKQILKDPATGAFYNLGPVEVFLLLQLDGKQTVEEICLAFGQHFGETLTEADLLEFLNMVASQGFLVLPGQAAPAPPAAAAIPTPSPSAPSVPQPTTPNTQAPTPQPAAAGGFSLQNILFWRKNFFDPDRLFNWLEPKIRFVWTRPFLLFTLLMIVSAGVILGTHLRELAEDFQGALRWESLVVGWLALLVVTLLHEFAHGLTCKHHGGEVHEVGFLLMLMMPCFYCNVSDAWLFRRKSQRLWVTLAGGYCDLILWSLAVFAWTVTLPGTLPHFIAWAVLTVCGGRIFFNFNPFMKLDGYYLLSDWAEIPNLRQRSLDLLMAHVRRLFWGAPRPDREPRGRFLLCYGIGCFLVSLTYMGLMLFALNHFAGSYLGIVGNGIIVLLGLFLVSGLFRGFTGGELAQMIFLRRIRTLLWLLFLAAIPTILWLVPMGDRATGAFQLRTSVRAEVRAPVSGFVKFLYCDEGDRVSPSAMLVQIEIPDLATRLAQKEAEMQESQAKLKLLKAGPRPEEEEEQKKKVHRARTWCELAEADLLKSKQALQAEIANLDKKIVQCQAEVEYSRYAYQRDLRLYQQEVLPRDQLEEKKKSQLVSESLAEQVLAQKRARLAVGTVQAEMELARREKELADAQGLLRVVQAGARPQEIDAEHARQARLKAELIYLNGLTGKVQVFSPIGGLITTPRLKEKVGQFLHEGELICTIEEPRDLEAEIVVSEQEMARVRVGQVVDLKARALPFRTFKAVVSRVAPVARTDAGAEMSRTVRPDTPGNVTVCCAVENPEGELCPGMTGHARIYNDNRPVLVVLWEKAMRYLRTEFWW